MTKFAPADFVGIIIIIISIITVIFVGTVVQVEKSIRVSIQLASEFA